jgi:hypothetical protein
MKKTLLLLSALVLFKITNVVAQAELNLPNDWFLCDNGLTIDATVTNTTDTGISYQWYNREYYNGQWNDILITNETNPTFNVLNTGRYKVIATLSDNTELSDEVSVQNKNNLGDTIIFDCTETLSIDRISFGNFSNVSFSYFYSESDALANNYSLYDFLVGQILYLRIEENDSLCTNIIEIYTFSDGNNIYANPVGSMGECSENSSTNIFDLTTNDAQILGGQNLEVSYFEDFNDANYLNNPIANPNNYQALSPNQTIYARVYEVNGPDCPDNYNSITQFQLLSAAQPTPNNAVNYIICDASSGTANDGLGEFNLPSRNALILSGLSTSAFSLSYHISLAEAQNNNNPIANPESYVTASTTVYTRVESTINNDCIEISEMNLKVQNTCEDVSISLLSHLASPRPGFEYKNKLIIENNGPTTVSTGSVDFTMDSLLMYNSATGYIAGTSVTQSAGDLTINFYSLAPGEKEEIILNFTVPADENLLGEQITSAVNYVSSSNDVNSENNTATLSEIIIGSYDPNDITESHGPEILHTTFTNDDYLYYTVRFQNVGTASAINVTIDNALDVRLDKTTFEMLHSSHTNTVVRVFDNLTWQFDNINLADSTNDEPNSHGYVHYKIKPLAGYSIGDIVPNTASIVFDFNSPIVTNTFNSTFIENALSTQDNVLQNVAVYPNPTSDFVMVTSQSSIAQIEVYSYVGHLVKKNKNQDRIDISSLKTGLYFIKIKDINGNFATEKVLKK